MDCEPSACNKGKNLPEFVYTIRGTVVVAVAVYYRWWLLIGVVVVVG